MSDTVNKVLTDNEYTAITATGESGTIHFNGSRGSVQIAEGASEPASTIRGLKLSPEFPVISYSLGAGQIMFAMPSGGADSISVTPS